MMDMEKNMIVTFISFCRNKNNESDSGASFIEKGCLTTLSTSASNDSESLRY